MQKVFACSLWREALAGSLCNCHWPYFPPHFPPFFLFPFPPVSPQKIIFFQKKNKEKIIKKNQKCFGPLPQGIFPSSASSYTSWPDAVHFIRCWGWGLFLQVAEAWKSNRGVHRPGTGYLSNWKGSWRLPVPSNSQSGGWERIGQG